MSPKRRRGGDVPWQRKLRKSAFGSRAGISTSSTGKGTFRERKWLEVASAAAAEAAAVAGNGQRLTVLRPTTCSFAEGAHRASGPTNRWWGVFFLALPLRASLGRGSAFHSGGPASGRVLGGPPSASLSYASLGLPPLDVMPRVTRRQGPCAPAANDADSAAARGRAGWRRGRPCGHKRDSPQRRPSRTWGIHVIIRHAHGKRFNRHPRGEGA